MAVIVSAQDQHIPVSEKFTWVLEFMLATFGFNQRSRTTINDMEYGIRECRILKLMKKHYGKLLLLYLVVGLKLLVVKKRSPNEAEESEDKMGSMKIKQTPCLLLCQPFKRKKGSNQPAKSSLFRNSRGTAIWDEQTIGKSREQRWRASFYKKREEVGRGYFEQNFIVRKREFEVVAVSHWLQARTTCFCQGKGNLPSSCWTTQASRCETYVRVLPSWLPNSNFELGFLNTFHNSPTCNLNEECACRSRHPLSQCCMPTCPRTLLKEAIQWIWKNAT